MKQNKGYFRKLFSIFLAILLVAGMMPEVVSAEPELPKMQNVRIEGNSGCWDAFEGADAYSITLRRAADDSFASSGPVYGQSTTSFDASSALYFHGDNVYYFTVQAFTIDSDDNWHAISAVTKSSNTIDYKKPGAESSFDITVSKGTASLTTAKKGETITITADAAPEGMEFDKWIVNQGDITLADENASTTTFTMPPYKVTLTATYKEKPVELPKMQNVRFEGNSGYWDAFEGADAYTLTLRRAADDSFASSGPAYGQSTTSYDASAALNFHGENVYYFTIQAYTIDSDDNWHAISAVTKSSNTIDYKKTVTPKPTYSASVKLELVSAPEAFYRSGESVYLRFRVTNTGDVTLTVNSARFVDRTDNFLENYIYDHDDGTGAMSSWLEPGESFYCTLSVPTTDADVTAGSFYIKMTRFALPLLYPDGTPVRPGSTYDGESPFTYGTGEEISTNDVEVTIPFKEQVVVDTITVTGVTEPKYGETTEFSFALPSEDGYKDYEGACTWVEFDTMPGTFADAADFDLFAYTSKTAWARTGMGETFNYKDGTYYVFVLPVELKAGYKWADSVNVTVNGKTGQFLKSAGPLADTVICVFGPLEKPEEPTPETTPEPTPEVTPTPTPKPGTGTSSGQSTSAGSGKNSSNKSGRGSGTSKTKSNTSTVKTIAATAVPKTSDTVDAVVYFLLLIASGIVLITVMVYRKKQNIG